MNLQLLERYSLKALDFVMEYGPKVILSVILLFVGLKFVKIIQKLINKSFEKSNLDETIRPFLVNLIGWGLKVLLFISVASTLGIETTSFVAIIGAAGLAVGLALQGTLANFAGGVLILIFKPFKVNDLIEAQGHLGVVQEIQIFITKILTPDNRVVVIPNGILSNGTLKNYTEKDSVRMDVKVGISYGANISEARAALLMVLKADKRVLSEPSPSVHVAELADSSVNLIVRGYCHPADYWDCFFDNLEACKIALDNAKIEIPFPQRVVHTVKQ
jgi:small conductance mechanosensitive channel